MEKTFVLAPDSFKESMSAKNACEAMERGIRKVFPESKVIQVPMADGGEGTVDALVDGINGTKIEVMVSGPIPSEKIKAYYGLLADESTAVIEMAKANGIELLAENKRNPLLTSTYGTGEMIKDALDKGVKKIIIGIGGSVTNDGGAGMAQALGVQFLDKNDKELPVGGGALSELAKVDVSTIDPRLKETEVVIASDVTNPLTGPNGASFVFGPQKGATPDMVKKLDENLVHYAAVIQKNLGIDIKDQPGSGAAGGLGAGLLVFTGAKMESGVDLVIQLTHLEEKIVQADYVFTGEGGMDFQTKFGKAPYGVAKIAKRYDKPVFACAGYIGEQVDILYEEGMTAIFGILDQAGPLKQALQAGESNLERTVENIVRVLNVCGG
ncbi:MULTISPECIES: glycerate kinase [Enterococcus]|uniref:glycerate kinase n=1 Tax=Enterococcus TaxID=1350 RepID=UPI001E3759DB|nr:MULTISPECIES: glycerate kinase [Enterococcus]MCE3183141.1 glycerate kinase [Enterococcus faecium]MCT4340455.1 glycerate kinase [Enterococcus durans]MCW8790179.1 glycerate kinase [Enterococcus faecium]MCW8792614.1 glycerate kinase [Enterococcus faecium]MCW8795183.1 glycerate kinase [Enterococcus faecium]